MLKKNKQPQACARRSRLRACMTALACCTLIVPQALDAAPHFITQETPLITPKIQAQIDAKTRSIPTPISSRTYRLTPAPLPTRSAQPTTQKSSSALVSPKGGLLRTQEFYMGNINALPKWTRVLSQIRTDKPTVDACDTDNTCQTTQLRDWRAFVKSQKGKTLKTQLKNINAYVNKFPYITDDRLWGKSDYWAAPLEFLKHSGDCEDYVILKYTTLRQLGVPADKIRLVVVKDTVRNIAHAILAVYTEDDIYILDSLFDAVLSHKQVLQYIPYYSVNENSRWAHVKSLK